MEFASAMGKPRTIFRAHNSCWRSKCVDRSFIMPSEIRAISEVHKQPRSPLELFGEANADRS